MGDAPVEQRRRPWGRGARGIAATLIVALGSQGCLGLGMYTRPGVPLCSECAAPGEQLDYRVLLIGDAGEDEGDTDVFKALSRVAAEHPEKTLVVFLGDNVYPLGLPVLEEPLEIAPDPLLLEPADDRGRAERILADQVAAIDRTGAEAVFIPGNHDWARAGPTGMARVLASEEYIASIAADPARVRQLPGNACPGPIVIDRGATLRVIVTDSVWLLEGDDPRGEDCEWGIEGATEPVSLSTNLDYYALLEQAVAGAGGRRVLFTAHHPLKTRGPHGGHITIVDLLFPFTLLRSWLFIPLPIVYPVVRYWFVQTDEDLVGEGNERMVARIEAALEQAGPQTVAAGGHEHSLQVFDDPRLPITTLVSGAGTKDTPVGRTDETVFKQHGTGFMVLDYFRDGRLSLRVIEPDGEEAHRELFGTWIE